MIWTNNLKCRIGSSIPLRAGIALTPALRITSERKVVLFLEGGKRHMLLLPAVRFCTNLPFSGEVTLLVPC